MDPHETKVFITILLVVVVIAAILVLFIISLIHHHRKLKFAYGQQVNAEIRTLESERKRIATDMHDDIGPLLSAVKLQIGCLNTTDAEDAETVEKAGSYINQIIDKLKETSNNLMPRVLANKGLIAAAEDFATDLNRTKTITVTTEIKGKRLQLNLEKEIHLYRIIQEAINNAIKHSRAKLFSINISSDEKNFYLELSDNGKGFNYKEVDKEEMGLGLRNILSRVDILKGELFVDTKPEMGVKYSITVPLDANDE